MSLVEMNSVGGYFHVAKSTFRMLLSRESSDRMTVVYRNMAKNNSEYTTRRLRDGNNVRGLLGLALICPDTVCKAVGPGGFPAEITLLAVGRDVFPYLVWTLYRGAAGSDCRRSCGLSLENQRNRVLARARI